MTSSGVSLCRYDGVGFENSVRLVDRWAVPLDM